MIENLFGSNAAIAAAQSRPAAARPGARIDAPPPHQQPNAEAVERIKEIGFGRWVEELRETKMAALREELLQRMGLSEDKLADMGPAARAAIERMIQDRINERLAANSADPSDAAAPMQGAAAATAGSAGAAAFAMAGGSAGVGPGPAAIGPATMALLLDNQETAGRDEGPGL